MTELNDNNVIHVNTTEYDLKEYMDEKKSQTNKKRSIFTPRNHYKPFEYPKAFEFYHVHEKMHWVVDEVSLHQDVMDWKTKLSSTEKYFLTQIFRLFTQSDVDVAGAYVTKYLPLFPKPEIRMMLMSFAAREAVHIQAYSHLIDTLGMPESTYQQFVEYEEMREKHEFIETFMDTNEKQIIQQIAAFSAFTEGMQLFSSFIMLLNFTRYNKMNGMGQMIAWSIKDESCLHGDTEVLTLTGWKKISEVDMDTILMQYNIKNKELSFTKPKDIIVSSRSESYIFESDSFHQHVTSDHRMVCEEGVFTASTSSGRAHYIRTGELRIGRDNLTTEDLKMINCIFWELLDPNWFYWQLNYVSSRWAREAIEYWIQLTSLYLINNESYVMKKEIKEVIDCIALLACGEYIESSNTFRYIKSSTVVKRYITHEPTQFYCVSVPGSAFLIRSNGKISVTGNCHVEGMTWLFKEILKEHRALWTDDIKGQLYNIAEKMVELEDKFIDLAFKTGGVQGLTEQEVKKYIRYIADRRLIALGMKGIFKVKKNPLPWVEEIINAPEHSNFFEQKGTSYSKGSLTGSWGSVWT